jgi:uncharacterized protein
MRFIQDPSSNANLIRGYGATGIKINDEWLPHAIMVTATAIRPQPTLVAVDDLSPEHVTRLLEFEPELVLLGTGARQVFPPPAFGAAFLQAGVGFEVMDTGAACRTFNVLVSEHRRVAALLLVG